MGQQQYSKKQVERSFRKFNDIANDLSSAEVGAWSSLFTNLVQFCENDPVMREVTEPLRTNTNVNTQEWLESVSDAHYDPKKRFHLPLADDERTALLYQFFLWIEETEYSIDHFCMSALGSDDSRGTAYVLNKELVEKFTREVRYRLAEISDDVAGQDSVGRESLLVFEHHDHSTNIYGDVHGSNIATGGSTISRSSAERTSDDDLVSALKALEPLLMQADESSKELVKRSLDILIQSQKDLSITKDQVADATKSIAGASPKIAERLKGIIGNIGTNVGTTVLTEGLKLGWSYYLGG
jgi:hypothetical protein